MLNECKEMSRIVFMSSTDVVTATPVAAGIAVVMVATGGGGIGSVMSTLTVAWCNRPRFLTAG